MCVSLCLCVSVYVSVCVEADECEGGVRACPIVKLCSCDMWNGVKTQTLKMFVRSKDKLLIVKAASISVCVSELSYFVKGLSLKQFWFIGWVPCHALRCLSANNAMSVCVCVFNPCAAFG